MTPENKKPRYLTKSAFKIASECPTKLSYLKKDEYPSTKDDNLFLKALAEGGYQVGELAKVYHPGGVSIDTLDYDEAIRLTDEALEKPQVTIYEAAIRYQNSFIRIDVLKKDGNRFDLIEVKAKSHDATKEDFFTKKAPVKLNSTWEPYLQDVAYQAWVLQKAKGGVVVPYLMLADKTAKAGIDGINQRFVLISKPTNRSIRVRVAPDTTRENLGAQLLVQVPVQRAVDFIFEDKYNGRSFAEHIQYLSDRYQKDERIKPVLTRDCRGCEYRIPAEMKVPGKKSGFEDCWIESAGFGPEDFRRDLMFDIWKLHFMKKDKLFEERRYFMDDVDEEDLAPKSKGKKKDAEVKPIPEPGLTNQDRQALQIEAARGELKKPFLDTENLAEVFAGFDYPLHFIDFETTRVAIPFHKGRHPYEQVAFQFSHHLVQEDGRIEHKDQFLSFERGKFPNYDFVRALKNALSTDNGTIFRYADHENTVLREIQSQLESDLTPPEDAEDLIDWIKEVTQYKTEEKNTVAGSRNMVDLKWLVQKFFYHPSMHGSNSIKAVLPAVLGESQYLQEKYAQPVYGKAGGIPSLNFRDHRWIEKSQDGKVKDPYKTLKPVFDDVKVAEGSLYQDEERIAEGGAAMTAYARMQFAEMSDAERVRVRDALYRYCELDTFAMVMIYEYWRHEIAEAGKLKKAS